MILLYEPSGRFSPLALILGLGVGGAVSIAIAFGYQLAGTKTIYAAMALPLILGAMIGVLVGALARAGKSRNPAASGALAVVCGALAIAAAFYFDFAAVREQLMRTRGNEDAQIAAALVDWSPADYIHYRYHTGWEVGFVGFNTMQVNGGMVYVGWLIEAVMILLPAFFIARRFAYPSFCEECNSWTEQQYSLDFNGVSAASLHAARAGADMDVLLRPRQSPGRGELAEYFVYACPHCMRSNFLSVGIVRRNWFGRKYHDWIVCHAAVDAADLEALANHLNFERARTLVAMATSRPPAKPG